MENQRKTEKTYERKLYSLEALLIRREELKGSGQKLVFTNGCFDILHLGHVDYLERARKLGDALLVAVNDDVSVKALKGDSRPINDVYARMRVLAALEFVDYVIEFGQETPFELIKQLKPDVLVKGGDYKVQEIVGAVLVIENGGKVIIERFVDGYSTTSILKASKE